MKQSQLFREFCTQNHLIRNFVRVTLGFKFSAIWILFQCKGSICDLFSNLYLFQRASYLLQWKNHRRPLTPIVKIFNNLIKSSHTWNMSKKCPSQIFTACRSDLDTSWKCFMSDSSELSCWNFYNGNQREFHFALSFNIGNDLFILNKYWFWE